MSKPNDLNQALRDLVIRETLYLLHYLGLVVDDADPVTKGRVKIQIPELGHKTADNGVWAYPRMGNSVETPRVGDTVEVYFIAGDKKRPVYISPAFEGQGMVPKQYSKPTTKVLWQNPDNGDYLQYDTKAKILEYLAGKIDLKIDSSDNLLFDLLVDTYDIKVDKKNKKMTITINANVITIDDGNKKIVLDTGSQTITLDDTNKNITLVAGSQNVTIDANAGKVSINGNLEVTP